MTTQLDEATLQRDLLEKIERTDHGKYSVKVKTLNGMRAPSAFFVKPPRIGPMNASSMFDHTSHCQFPRRRLMPKERLLIVEPSCRYPSATFCAHMPSVAKGGGIRRRPERDETSASRERPCFPSLLSVVDGADSASNPPFELRGPDRSIARASEHAHRRRIQQRYPSDCNLLPRPGRPRRESRQLASRHRCDDSHVVQDRRSRTPYQRGRLERATPPSSVVSIFTP